MNITKLFFQSIKPGIPKRYLLIVAAIVWTFAGGMLLYRGISTMILFPAMIWLKVTLSLTGGILFFFLLFSRISFKHTRRIVNLPYERPCLFSFFNWQSYGMMMLMITSGIILHKTGILSHDYLSVFQVTMGIPLFLSAFRFYYFGINYQKAIAKLG